MSSSREQEWATLQQALRSVLDEHGRHGRLSGDYWLVEEDGGAYEQKVLVFDNECMTPELLEAVSEVLWDYSREWRVAFVEANRDGDELVPRSGLGVSAMGPELFDPPRVSEEAARETQALYESLGELLSRRGRSDAFGDGDYWIVDDGWVPRSHKVCVFDIAFLSPHLAAEVQSLLKEQFPQCLVWFQLEVREPGKDVPLPGLRVSATSVKHDWDRDLLRSIFGERFAW